MSYHPWHCRVIIFEFGFVIGFNVQLEDSYLTLYFLDLLFDFTIARVVVNLEILLI